MIKIIETERQCTTHAFYKSLGVPEKTEKTLRTNHLTKKVFRGVLSAYCRYVGIELIEKNDFH